MEKPTTPLEALKAIVEGGPYEDPDGGQNGVELLPPMSDEELRRGQNEKGLPWPNEIRELLAYAKGFRLFPYEVDFTQGPWEFPVDGIGYGAQVCPDFCGNLWFVEVDQQSGEWGAIWFLCHDPFVYVIQSPTIASFLYDIHATMLGDETPMSKTGDLVLEEISKHGGNLMTLEEATRDRTIAPLLKTVDPSMNVCDLRAAIPGTGFTRWGTIEAVRLGRERVFLVPPKPPRPPSVWSRLRGIFKK